MRYPVYLIFALLSFNIFAQDLMDCSGSNNNVINDYEFIKLAIKKCKVKDVDSLIRLLSDELKSHFTLIYSSHAIEEQKNPGTVTVTTPRAILFSKKDNILISFHTNKDKKESFQKLEIIELSQKDHQLHAREVNFQEKKKPRFDDNPQSCIQCHSKNTKPLWANYDSWPGVYGSRDDTLTLKKEGYPFSDDTEFKSYQKFLKSPSIELDRLNALKWPKDKIKYQVAFSPEKGSDYSVRPNGLLSAEVSRLQSISLFSRMKSNPDYERFKKAFLWDTFKCSEIQLKKDSEVIQFMNQEIKIAKQVYPDNSFTGFLPILDHTDFALKKSVDTEAQKFFNKYMLAAQSSQYYYEGIGLELDRLSDNNWTRQVKASSIFHRLIYQIFLDTIKKSSKSEVDIAFSPNSNYLDTKFLGYVIGYKINGPEICNLLEKEINQLQKEIKNIDDCKTDVSPSIIEPTAIEQIKKIQKLINNPFLDAKCTLCHSANSLNPIPFDDIGKFQKILEKNPSLVHKIESNISSGQMPPNNKLSEPEKLHLLQYLNELKK